MAMTLRTGDQDDHFLAELAKTHGVSKHEAALYAIRSTFTRECHEQKVDEVVQAMLTEWGPVFDALAKT